MKRLLLASTLLAASAATAFARDGGGVVDFEVPNRARVRGTIAPAFERETYRTRAPRGASVAARVRSGKGAPSLLVRAAQADGADAGGGSVEPGATADFAFVAAQDGLVRFDVEGDAETGGDYSLDLVYATQRRVEAAGTPGAEPLRLTFAAEAGTKVRLAASAARGTGEVAVARLLGPDGVEIAFERPPRRPVRLPATGTWTAEVVLVSGAPQATATARLSVPRRATGADLRDRKVGGTDGRLVTRVLDSAGGSVDVPELAIDQLVTTDISGAAVDVPSGALPVPTAVTVRTTSRFEDPDGAVSPAGLPVEFRSKEDEFAQPVEITIPFDAAAFPTGFDGLTVLTRDDRGNVTAVDALLDVDPAAGTVSFPSSHFSAYAAFGPAVELALVVRTAAPGDLVRAADGTIHVALDDAVAVLDAATGEVSPFAGGGTSTADGTDRAEFDFDTILGLAPGGAGSLLVLDGSDDSDASRVFRIAADGKVTLVAGDGTFDFVEGAVARQTGLPGSFGIAESGNGDVFVGTSFLGTDEDGRGLDVILRVAAADGRVATVAGGGTEISPDRVRPREFALRLVNDLKFDSAGRLVVASVFSIVRFDLAGDSSTLVAGVDPLLADRFATAAPTVNGQGAPLRNVRLEFVSGLSFDPADADVLYATDAFSALLWRLDLRRDRAFVAAGTYLGFDQSIVSIPAPPAPQKPTSPLRFPIAALAVGRQVLVAEPFSGQVRTLRPR